MKLGQWLGFLCLVIALVVLWQIRQMLLLVFAAVVLATALNSLARRLQKSGMSRRAAVPLALSIVVVVMLLFLGLIVPPFIDQFLQLVRLLPEAVTEISFRLEQFIEQRPPWFPILELPTDLTSLTQQLQPLVRNILGNFFEFFSNSLNALLELLVVIVLTIMLLANPTAYRFTFLKLFPSFYRRRADEILVKCEVSLGNWISGLLISSSFVALLSFIGLWVLQIEFILAHALLAGLLNFIPNIGPTLSIVFPLTVALLDAPWKALFVIGLYLIIQQIEAYYLTPTVMQQQVSLLPALTLAAQIFFASFFGFLGLLLALPLTVVAKTWIEEALVKDILDKWGNDRLETVPASVAQDNSSSGAIVEPDITAAPIPTEALPPIDRADDA
ncbi:AI-2E family transporter [Oscillatoria sp. FACHB-1407]|uniref:AI-2E family transporter n=1 Tax=Oscillatoria sp. FACHB-1407 TaxID=2692847 RepID=UPI001687032D|nr:AI-2E family transporter [Oscillatoria sp. FACHB-1407]MBD2461071.1 AI-2E family transporter [Oscillatoria sp. FACHB-1407]